MQLRPYQLEAVESVYHYLRQSTLNPCIELPTGAGKTLVITQICIDVINRWSGRILILSHVKELLAQGADKLQAMCPELKFGINCAGLKRRDTTQSVILASIQSVYQSACDLGAFDLIVVDEAHLIPPNGEGRYQQFFAEAKIINPLVRIIGLTATPYRMESGLLCTPDGILNEICYRANVRQLIHQGFLCPLISKAGIVTADTDSLHIRGGEFVTKEVESLMDTDELVVAACNEIVETMHDRQSCLIFASGIDHGQHIVEVLREHHDINCGFVCGETPTTERDELLIAFKDGHLQYLCNVNVLTTGFDAPNIDCIALLRPTMSPGLYYQMVGRGFRLHEGKTNCLVLDFGNNVMRHGPVDRIRVETKSSSEEAKPLSKVCPHCHSIIAAGYGRCPDCGFVFPPPERKKHESKASEEAILSDQSKQATWPVRDIEYTVHVKRNAAEEDPRTLEVSYQLSLHQWQSEYICLEHTGYARGKARQWWLRRSGAPMPETIEEAVQLAQDGALCDTEAITIRSTPGEKYDTIVDYQLGPIPDYSPDINLGPIPF